ncbi:hypothetical protein M406DRAFT_354877 [Cryphonectria parasitica EP155]|uniref:Uncharacterized protein n=1 Tax=Cryphonectria parasitica (strain ATCC 38755 / EP155) TaxID=660469 RepID=A0A9P4Y2Y2_CRYP1|nr:uncharacterized protein M406DRAFT_358514 [Cryphonectria parasitica EP155]XP_040771666.1 uncharacterized protein M406DRAFT_358302 [Cryphonectria parasitica EP155]XP_040772187.1 uncharacterized protein M406DRAFT_358513 [Cryphonectria parasitica EP155]XP_040774673.1 uncharacterized protein M406DRAFT_357181 [Cryphonectria parasitica EP155]XP_040776348.1 uncharacterized protein M406DRAFT_355904 [Cryphonectria parasitica EP155]XP_040779295.1 uncharacterized protein M406DRAFT_354877 [Cryphonectria
MALSSSCPDPCHPYHPLKNRRQKQRKNLEIERTWLVSRHEILLQPCPCLYPCHEIQVVELPAQTQILPSWEQKEQYSSCRSVQIKLAMVFLSIAIIVDYETHSILWVPLPWHKRNPFDLVMRNTFIPHELVLSFDNTLDVGIGVDLRIYLDYTSRAELVKRVPTLREGQ